jgi:hypothetical protein
MSLLFCRCDIVQDLWSLVFCLFDVSWVMLDSVKDLVSYWKRHFVKKFNTKIWRVVPLCLMWCLWRERNN